MDHLIQMLWRNGGYLTGCMIGMRLCTIRWVENFIPLYLLYIDVHISLEISVIVLLN